MGKHEVHVIAEDQDTRTYECTDCGWLTIETIEAPDYHTPIEQRISKHQARMLLIDSGRIWDMLTALAGPHHIHYAVFLRRRLSNGERNHVVLWATWLGGFTEVAYWPWTDDGIMEAQRFINREQRESRQPVVWKNSGYPVGPCDLLAHAPSRWPV